MSGTIYRHRGTAYKLEAEAQSIAETFFASQKKQFPCLTTRNNCSSKSEERDLRRAYGAKKGRVGLWFTKILLVDESQTCSATTRHVHGIKTSISEESAMY